MLTYIIGIIQCHQYHLMICLQTLIKGGGGGLFDVFLRCMSSLKSAVSIKNGSDCLRINTKLYSVVLGLLVIPGLNCV